MEDGSKINYSKLSPQTLDKIKKWDANQPAQKQLVALKDLADMTQEMLGVLEDASKSNDEFKKELAPVLLDIREKLQDISSKETPEQKDFTKPIVDGLTKLEAKLAKIDFKPEFKPNINVDAPAVSVSPSVDLKGIEKILKTDLPKAFNDAIKLIPEVELQENTDYTDKFEAMLAQLASIDTATRMKPQPSTMKVTNPDGSAIGSLSGSTIYITVLRANTGDPDITYIGKAVPGSATSDAAWQIARLDENTNLDLLYADGGAFTQIYDNREALTYA